MKVLIYMGGGFDTYGPSRHLYHALIEDLLREGHTVHLIENHSTGNDPDAPPDLVSFQNNFLKKLKQYQKNHTHH